ncbi:MAG TPA: hypothetical protein DDW67_05590 [Elusimicrobia bacterium]|jgi:hypothetical protein|nr:hypothetical protein [Elusimicrobiota bacterium]
MARKNRKRAAAAQEKDGAARGGYLIAAEQPDGGGEISRPGWIVIALSVLTAAAGYFLLSKAAPGGRDLYSNLSPFVILAGYIGVAVGIMLPGRRGEGEGVPASAGEKSPA